MSSSLALVPFVSSPRPAPERIHLDPEASAQAEQRYSVIAPILEPSHRSRRERMEEAAAASGQSSRTVARWISRYQAGGFPALADSGRSDRGHSRFFARNRNAAILVAYLFLDQRMSVAFCHEQLARDAASLGLTETPSYGTVRAFLRDEISPAMRTLAREGSRIYRERMAPFLSRGYRDVAANEIWVEDVCIHDVEVSNDIFPELPYGSPVRLRLDALLDFRSRKVVGAAWGLEGNVAHACSRHAPRCHGLRAARDGAAR